MFYSNTCTSMDVWEVLSVHNSFSYAKNIHNPVHSVHLLFYCRFKTAERCNSNYKAPFVGTDVVLKHQLYLHTFQQTTNNIGQYGVHHGRRVATSRNWVKYVLGAMVWCRYKVEQPMGFTGRSSLELTDGIGIRLDQAWSSTRCERKADTFDFSRQCWVLVLQMLS